MPSPRRLATVAAVAAVLAILLGAWQTSLAETIEVGAQVPAPCGGMAAGTKGAVRLQFAFTQDCAIALVSGWQSHRVDGLVLRSTVIDFPFLIAYGIAVCAMGLWLAVRSTIEQPRWVRPLRAAAALAAVAAACDAAENIGLLRALGAIPVGPTPFWTFVLASGKFVLLGIALLTAATAWINIESRRAAGRHGTRPPGQRPPPPLAHRAMYLWPLRVPILTGAVLLALPSLLLFENPSRYLSGVFDPLEETALLPIAMLALLCAWTVAITGRLVLAYGAARMELPPLGITGRGHVPAHLWGWSAPLAVPIVATTIRHSHVASHSSIGAMVLYSTMGVIAACLTLAIVLTISRRVAGPISMLEGWPYQALLSFFGRHPCLGHGFVEGEPAKLLPGHGIAMVLAQASVLTYLLVGYWTRQIDRPLFVSTLAFVLLLTLMLSWVFGLLAFLFNRTRAPLFVFLFIYVLFLNFGIDRFITTDLEYETFERSRPRPTLVQTLTAGTDRPIVVAASGGGIQAAAWTARVLTGLADDNATFEGRVRLISGVSGGSVGAMHYLTQQVGCAPDGTADAVTPRSDALQHAMESSLHGAGWGLVFQDLPRTLVPFFVSPLVNRGSVLEDAWKRDRRLAASVTDDTSAALMANWGSHVASGACPGVVFNAMVAETGEPMLFSTALLPASLARFAFERHYPRLDVRLATAARLSAAFPYVSPATHAQHDVDPGATLPPGDAHRLGYRHVVDGGYFDNFGVATAAEWLNAELLALDQAGKTLPSRVLLIEICEEPSCSSSTPSGDLAPGGPRRSLPYQLLAPVSALYQMRGAAQRSRNRWHVALLQQRWAPRVKIESALFPYPLEAGPMSWHLSEGEKTRILESWEHSSIKVTRRAVGDFLDAAGPPDGSPP